MSRTFAKICAVLSLVVLSACAVSNPDTDTQVDLGNFALGHNVAVTKNAKKVGPSRSASAEEWELAMEGAMAKRFDRYEGEKFYHIGINLDAYALAVPGIPLVLSPKSILVVSVNVWDDAENKKLTEEPHRLTVFEQLDGETMLGSGLTRTREEQVANLSANMASAVERYLLANAEWFGGEVSEDARLAAEKDVLKIPAEGELPQADAALAEGFVDTTDSALEDGASVAKETPES